MEPVLTPDAMARADQRTIAAGTPVATLMERAGTAVAWDVRGALRGCYGTRAVVVCGKGNNGGDGLVAARVLARWGARVHVFELEDGVDERELARALSSAHVVVDAMFGTGLRRALDGDAAMVVERLRDWDGLTVAVDIPSGVDGLTGAVHGTAVHADRTVTFAARKPGLLFEPGRSHAGEVHGRRHRHRPRARRRRARPARLLRRLRRRAVPAAARAGRAQVVERGDGGRRLSGDDRRADVHESRRDARRRRDGVVLDPR